MAFPSPEYERSAHPKAARIFTLVMAVLSVVIVGDTIILNLETITLDDIIALIAPFVFMFFFWLFVKWMRRETGVKWVPWAP